LGTVLAVLFLTFLDTTIVSVTLGDLEVDLSAGVVPLQWVINAYAVVFASFMLAGGSLADRLGRKWVMLAGLAVFCVGSVLAAVAGSIGLVIAGRAVMGLGAAASEPGTLSIIRQLFPDQAARARALGAWSAVSGLALALGPVIGGLLVGADGWRAVFWFNLAAGGLIALAVWAFVPDSRDPEPGRLDLTGFALGTSGLFGVIFAAISGEYQGFGTWWVVTLFVAGGLALLALVRFERRTPTPMLDPRYLRTPIVRVALFAAFAVYLGVFAIFFLTALYLDVGLHYSGWRLAGMFAPMAAAIVAGGLVAGPWVGRVGSRAPMVTGCALAAAGMLLARYELGAELSFALLSLALAAAGLGFGITVVPMTSAVLTNIPARHSGVAASATNTARQLGAVVGVTVLGALVNAKLTHTVDSYGPFQLLGPGFRKSVLEILETGGHAGSFSLDDIPPVFVRSFLDGVRTGLVVATVLIALAGLIAAFVRDPRDKLADPPA
jgi:MFS family permease